VNSQTRRLARIVLILPALVLLALPSAAVGQVATDFYGQAILLPLEAGPAPSGEEPGGPRGVAEFHRVRDAAGSTRVVVQLEGLQPGASVASVITSGDCQGDNVATLNPLTADKSGKAEATTVLVGQEVEFGRWYAKVMFCDSLNPGQVCSLCGKVSQIMTIGGGGTGSPGSAATPTPAPPGMPPTGAPGPATSPGLAVLLVGCALLLLIAIAYQRFSRAGSE
jgi:hypothetical protein